MDDKYASSAAESDTDCLAQLPHRGLFHSSSGAAQPVTTTQPLAPTPPPLPLTAATAVPSASLPLAPASTSDRPHACPHPGCDKAYYKLGKLNRHLTTHSDTRLHTCPHSGCTRAFHRAEHLHRHLLSHSNERRHSCQQAGCGRAFLTSTHLRRHMKTHDCAYHCTVEGCGQSFNKHARLTQHLAEQHSGHTAAAGLVCSHSPCALSFTSRALLNKHVRLTHLPHRYTCVDCLASFARHIDWRRHQRQHDDLPVPCPTCQQQVVRKRLSQHQHQHTHASSTTEPSTTALHECDAAGCDKRFVSVSGLAAHKRAVHRVGECAGFECDECGREFGYRSVLDRHVETQHGPGADERKRRRSEKEKAFGRLGKKLRKEDDEEDAEGVGEDTEHGSAGDRSDSEEREQLDGGERDSDCSALLAASTHATAICVM